MSAIGNGENIDWTANSIVLVSELVRQINAMGHLLLIYVVHWIYVNSPPSLADVWYRRLVLVARKREREAFVWIQSKYLILDFSRRPRTKESEKNAWAVVVLCFCIVFFVSTINNGSAFLLGHDKTREENKEGSWSERMHYSSPMLRFVCAVN